jgi:hypothetical protein
MNVWLCAGGSKARGAQPGRGAAAISPTGPCQTKGSLAYMLAFAGLSLGPHKPGLAWLCDEQCHRQMAWFCCWPGLHGCIDACSHMFLQLLDSAALAERYISSRLSSANYWSCFACWLVSVALTCQLVPRTRPIWQHCSDWCSKAFRPLSAKLSMSCCQWCFVLCTICRAQFVQPSCDRGGRHAGWSGEPS